MTESTATVSVVAAAVAVAVAVQAGQAGQRFDFLPPHFFHTLDHQLCDAVAAVHVIGLGGIGVEQHNLDLAAVGAVDEARRVDHADAVFEGETAAWQHEACVAGRYGDGDARGHEQPAACRSQVAIVAGAQVEAGITRMGVGGQSQIGVESNDRDGKHRYHLMWWGCDAIALREWLSHPFFRVCGMELGNVLELVRGIDGVDDVCTDRDAIVGAVGQVQQLMSWCESRQLLHATLLAGVSSFPEKLFADAAHTGLRQANRVFERAETAALFPGCAQLLADGLITIAYLDTLSRALRSLEPEQRPRLIAQAARFAAVAASATVDEFARVVRAEVRRIETDDGAAKLEQQRRATRLRAWFDEYTGMLRLAGEFDPVTGLALMGRLDNMVATLFASGVPDGCPTDPSAKQDYLRALALLALTAGHGFGSGSDPGSGWGAGRTDVIVVVDTTEPEPDGRPRVDWGFPVEVPMRVLADLAGDANVSTIVVRNGVVLHAPGLLNLGRTTRLANAAQRRALRGLYPTCAVPGCEVRFQYCKIHHVHWWRHGGRTDLCNLLPVCSQHHQSVHRDGWVLTLHTDRTLIIDLPDGTQMATGPPSRLRRRAA